MTLMHKEWHHAHLRLSLTVTQSTSEPQLQEKLPPKEPRHGNPKSPRSHTDSAAVTAATTASFRKSYWCSNTLNSPFLSILCFILFLSWLSPASAWRTGGPTAPLSTEIELLMHRNRWDFSVCLNFFKLSPHTGRVFGLSTQVQLSLI